MTPRRWGAAAAVMVLAATGSAHGQSTGGDPVFTALAVAEGVRTTVAIPPDVTIVENIADPGAPVAQAQVTTFGGVAFASTAYPGDTAANAPQLAAAGGLPFSPDYPLYVYAEHPVYPTARAEGPAGYAMEASADAAAATAEATTGAGAGGDDGAGKSRSRTVIEVAADGSVVARAESIIEDARFGTLVLGRVHSTAIATWEPGAGDPKVERSTVVDGASANGVAIEIGPDGARVADAVIPPAPGNDAIDAALAAQGIQVRTVQDPADPAAGAHVVEVVAVPDVDRPEAHIGGTVRYRVGGARASIIPGVTRPGSGGGASGDIPVPPASGPSAVVDADPAVAIGAATVPTAATAKPAPAPTRAATPAERLRLARDLNKVVGDFYLLLILTALGGLAASLAWRTTGVHRSWRS